MTRLARPYIPMKVRVQVAERQFDAATSFSYENGDRHASVFRTFVDRDHWKRDSPLHRQLAMFLRLLFGDAKVDLHHRPGLLNRRRYIRNGKTFYDPPANSAEHLVYLPEHEHDIETRVRGVGAQHSDLALARKRKRAERKKTRPKRKWPSRPMRSANRWPSKRVRS